MSREYISFMGTRTPYFFDRATRRVQRAEMRTRGKGAGEVVHEVIFDVYVRPDGGLFDLPTNEHPDPVDPKTKPGRTAISVMENLTNGKQQNLYIAKGCVFATSTQQIIAALERGEAAKQATLKVRALRAPGAREALQGREMAAAMGPAIVQAVAALKGAEKQNKTGAA
jgi:hypothetical protein